MRLIYLTLAICLAFAASAPVASADDPPSMRAAKRHYDRGQKLFALQKFEQALEQFQKAFDAKPIPDFLFNIGQCHRNLGDYDAAIFSFKRYLKLDPEASNREQVEELISQLEDKKAAEDARKLGLRKEDGEELPPPPPDRPFYKKWWFWTGVVVVGAAGAGGGYYLSTRDGGPPPTSLGRNIVFGK
jgi:tetratricopeptide (TPR) repeat protein